MAISLLYNTRRQRKTRIGTLTIEATLSENHEATCTVTDQPIETGSRISDHIILDPSNDTSGMLDNETNTKQGIYLNHLLVVK